MASLKEFFSVMLFGKESKVTPQPQTLKPKPVSKIKKAIVVSQLRRGDVIVCSECAARMYTVVNHVTSGQVLRASDLAPAEDDVPKPEDGQVLMCLRCGGALFVGNYETGFAITVEDKKDDGKRYKTLRAPD